MAIFEKAIALDIGQRSIKGVSYKFSLGELQLLDCRYRLFEDFDLPEDLLEYVKNELYPVDLYTEAPAAGQKKKAGSEKTGSEKDSAKKDGAENTGHEDQAGDDEAGEAENETGTTKKVNKKSTKAKSKTASKKPAKKSSAKKTSADKGSGRKGSQAAEKSDGSLSLTEELEEPPAGLLDEEAPGEEQPALPESPADEIELDESDITDDRPPVVRLYRTILEQFIADNWGFDNVFLINLPADSAIIRDIQVPFSDPKKVVDVLPFELENLIPLPIEQCVIETNLWGSREDGEATSLTFCVPNSRIDERTDFFLSKHLPLKNVTLDCVALSRLITETADFEFSPLCGQLSIGSSRSIFNLIKNNELVFSRVLNIGGDDFTMAIVEALKTDFNTAEEIKIRLGLDLSESEQDLNEALFKNYKLSNPKVDRILEAWHDICGDLLQELQLSMSAAGIKESLPAILISGGGSRLGGLQSWLARELGSDDLPVYTGTYDFVPHFPEPTAIDIYASSVGQVYHQVYTRRRAVNFLKGNIRNLLKGQNDWAALKWPVISLVASLIMAVTSYFININNLEKQVEDAKVQLVEVFDKGFSKKYKEANGDILLYAKKLAKGQKQQGGPKVLQPEEKVLNALKVLSEVMPGPETKFEYGFMQMSVDDIKLQGVVDNFAAVTDIKKMLEDSGRFSTVEVSGKTSIKKGSLVRVTYKLKLKKGALE